MTHRLPARLMSRAYLVALSAAASFGCIHSAQAQSSGDLHVEIVPRAGTKLRIRDLVGGVTVEASSSDKLEITGTKVGAPEDTRRITVLARTEGDTLVVCALWPGEDPSVCRGDGKGSDHGSDSMNGGAHVELHLKVPAQIANVDAATVEGQITVAGVHADVRASAIDGAVSVKSGGAISATAVNGSVSAVAAAGASVSLSSTQGTVSLALPPSAAVDVEASTVNGDISSAFGAVASTVRPGLHSAHFLIGGGGAPVKLVTVIGDVRVVRS